MNEDLTNSHAEATSYIVPTLRLNDGLFLTSFVSDFLSFITPHDLPLVYCILELLRDAFRSEVSVLKIILEALKVESGWLCVILVIFLLSIFPFVFLISWSCSKSIEHKKCRRNSVNNIVPFTTRIVAHQIDVDQMSTNNSKLVKLNRRKKALIFVLQTIILFLIAGITTMLITNEQVSLAIKQTPIVARASLTDTATFIRDANQKIQFRIFDNFDKTYDKIKIDLEDIDKLVGDPVIRQISIRTGLDLIFESISDILTSSRNLSNRIQMLNETLLKALMLANDSAVKIDEIQIQLSVLQRQCNHRDRPLCETLKIKSLEDIGFVSRLKHLYHHPVLKKLRAMQIIDGNNYAHNLSVELNNTKETFKSYSRKILDDSIYSKDDILKEISLIKEGLKVTNSKLSAIVHNLLERVDEVYGHITPWLDNFNEAGLVSWLVGLAAALCSLCCLVVLLGALSTVCFHQETISCIVLVISSTIICLFNIFLGVFTILEMLLGGHGEVFVCRPLHESSYTIVGKLLDFPGIVYRENTKHGILAELLVPLDHNTKPFINASLAEVLYGCENHHPAYSTFQIENLLDLQNTLDYHSYLELDRAFSNLKASETPFISFTIKLQKILEEMLADSKIDLISTRKLLEVSPEKEAITFIDQMQRVSIQIQDVPTSSRMTSLGSKARRVQAQYLAPLDILRNEIVYQLTALELQFIPWSQQLKNSFEQLRQAQVYLDNEAVHICGNFSEKFQKRLLGALELSKTETLEELNHSVAPCSPLFDIFSGIRQLFCLHIINPINGLWLASLINIFLWTLCVPITLYLASTLRDINRLIIQSRLANTHQNGAPVDEFISVTEQSNVWRSVSPQYQSDFRSPDHNRPEINRSNWSADKVDDFVETESLQEYVLDESSRFR